MASRRARKKALEILLAAFLRPPVASLKGQRRQNVKIVKIADLNSLMSSTSELWSGTIRMILQCPLQFQQLLSKGDPLAIAVISFWESYKL